MVFPRTVTERGVDLEAALEGALWNGPSSIKCSVLKFTALYCGVGTERLADTLVISGSVGWNEKVLVPSLTTTTFWLSAMPGFKMAMWLESWWVVRLDDGLGL